MFLEASGNPDIVLLRIAAWVNEPIHIDVEVVDVGIRGLLVLSRLIAIEDDLGVSEGEPSKECGDSHLL